MKPRHGFHVNIIKSLNELFRTLGFFTQETRDFIVYCDADIKVQIDYEKGFMYATIFRDYHKRVESVNMEHDYFEPFLYAVTGLLRNAGYEVGNKLDSFVANHPKRFI